MVVEDIVKFLTTFKVLIIIMVEIKQKITW